MVSNTQGRTMPGSPSGVGFDRSAAVTRSLLGYGVAVGPFYLVVGLVQAFVRDGFSFARHPLSVLANGPGGWVQTANFALSGLMVIAAAVGFARVLRPQSRAVSWFVGAYGLCILAAAVFRADPMDGFPAGTPLGPPTTITTPGLIHFIVGALGFIALGVSCFIAARAMSRRKESGYARLSLVSGLVVFGGFFGGFAIPNIGTAGIWLTVVVGWAWLSVMSMHLYRVAPNPPA
jgi:hypothetical protein